MRVVVVGASGNAGTSLLHALAGEERVEEVVGVARRHGGRAFPRTRWEQADIGEDDLVPLFRGAAVVVHLAWAIQPSRDLDALRRTNVHGSTRLLDAVAEAGVPALVYASSVGAYSAGPKDRRVDESWPTDGIPTSFYSRHKAEVERLLDRFEEEHPDVRVVRLRPGLVFKRRSASEQRRYFAGPFLPGSLLRPGLVPLVPDHPRLRFQCVHSLDVGEAYRLAIVGDARGAFNVAAEPVIDPALIARVLRARPVRVPEAVLRAGAEVAWRARLQPSPSGWVDLGLGVPLMDVTRARRELGWEPRRSAEDAFRELLAGLRAGAGGETPPLEPDAGGPGRAEEVATGVGARDDARRDQ